MAYTYAIWSDIDNATMLLPIFMIKTYQSHHVTSCHRVGFMTTFETPPSKQGKELCWRNPPRPAWQRSNQDFPAARAMSFNGMVGWDLLKLAQHLPTQYNLRHRAPLCSFLGSHLSCFFLVCLQHLKSYRSIIPGTGPGAIFGEGSKNGSSTCDPFQQQ